MNRLKKELNKFSLRSDKMKRWKKWAKEKGLPRYSTKRRFVEGVEMYIDENRKDGKLV